MIRGVDALPRIGVPPSRNCFHFLRRANDKVHSRAEPFAVQPPYHKALTSNLCSLTEIPSRRFAKPRARVPAASSGVRKRTPHPVTEQRATGQLIYKPRVRSIQCRVPLSLVRFFRGNVSLYFGDVLVTQMGELCSERVFVREAAQIEDEGVVLDASDHWNG